MPTPKKTTKKATTKPSGTSMFAERDPEVVVVHGVQWFPPSTKGHNKDQQNLVYRGDVYEGDRGEWYERESEVQIDPGDWLMHYEDKYFEGYCRVVTNSDLLRIYKVV